MREHHNYSYRNEIQPIKNWVDFQYAETWRNNLHSALTGFWVDLAAKKAWHESRLQFNDVENPLTNKTDASQNGLEYRLLQQRKSVAFSPGSLFSAKQY